jgi:hypothetical protein
LECVYRISTSGLALICLNAHPPVHSGHSEEQGPTLTPPYILTLNPLIVGPVSCQVDSRQQWLWTTANLVPILPRRSSEGIRPDATALEILQLLASTSAFSTKQGLVGRLLSSVGCKWSHSPHEVSAASRTWRASAGAIQPRTSPKPPDAGVPLCPL